MFYFLLDVTTWIQIDLSLLEGKDVSSSCVDISTSKQMHTMNNKQTLWYTCIHAHLDVFICRWLPFVIVPCVIAPSFLKQNVCGYDGSIADTYLHTQPDHATITELARY